jgi:hypothetical protein
MNNLLPSSVKLHQKYDLKGSTYKRKVRNMHKDIWVIANHNVRKGKVVITFIVVACYVYSVFNDTFWTV